MTQNTRLFKKTLLAVTVAFASGQSMAAGFQINAQSATGIGRAFAGDAVIADNAAVMDEIGFKAEISNLSDNKPNKSTLNKIQFLSGIWNSMPNKNFNDPKNNEISNYYFNPVIIHLAGIRRRDRVEFIKKYKNLFI